jgi:predicted ribosome quality control (RQC) complex YloA/Tae2 family protein
MHLKAAYIERFVEEYQQTLEGAALEDAFSVSKNEVFFIFGKQQSQSRLIWRVQFEAESVFISFPEELAVFRNRQDLFPELHGLKAVKIQAHPGERSFHIVFGENIFLLFKLHGRNANIAGVFTDRCLPFRKEIKKDLDFRPESLKSLAEGGSTSRTGSGKDSSDKDEKGEVYIVKKSTGYGLITEKQGEIIAACSYIREAWHEYARLAVSSYYFYKRKQEQLSLVSLKLKQSSKLLENKKNRLSAIRKNGNFRHLGDLIMSHLPQLKPGMKKAEVYDYLQEMYISVPLNTQKTPQENAEHYYRKAKSQHIESEFLEAHIKELEKKVSALKQEKNSIEQAEDSRSLKAFSGTKKAKEEKRLPYREFEFLGYRILVGRSSADNDELSFKTGKKNDLWLHARDVPGSHVLIKNKPGQGYPPALIEYAARLAAWYSRRKQDSLCPVIYTERKFVRKKKGAAPGQVIVDREQIIMVVPEAPAS